jgi:glucosamine 6-phosphate synthetase-like amidotransferase/phosphosugar isomerase protein
MFFGCAKIKYMTTATIPKKVNTVDTFEVKGEKFVVLKKEYLDELMILMRSFLAGERLLKEGKTRSFSEFLKYISKK